MNGRSKGKKGERGDQKGLPSVSTKRLHVCLSKKELKMANPLPNQRGAETFHPPKNYLNLNY